MTTFHRVDVTCPCCTNQFQATILTSTNTFGGQSTDFQTHAIGFSPLPLAINTCNLCGYSGTISAFKEHVEISDDIRERVNNELRPLVQNAPPDAAMRYDFAGRIALWQGQPDNIIADYYLKAAWCAVEDGQPEAEMRYRQLAIQYFRQWLESIELKHPQRLTITYLVGELYRRVGDDFLARKWFDRVILDGSDDPANQQMINFATRQRDNPQDRFGQ